SRSLPTVPPAAARVFAVFRIRLHRRCARLGRTTASSIRPSRVGLLAVARSASPFRSGSNNMCRSTSPVRAMARLKSALPRLWLRLAGCPPRHFVQELQQLLPRPIYRETAPAPANRLRRARLNFPAPNNRARDELPDQR